MAIGSKSADPRKSTWHCIENNKRLYFIFFTANLIIPLGVNHKACYTCEKVSLSGYLPKNDSIQWGSKVWAPQAKMCTNVHNEAKERWKISKWHQTTDQTFPHVKKSQIPLPPSTPPKPQKTKKWRLQKLGHPAESTACTAPFAKLRPASVMDCSQSSTGKTRWCQSQRF